MKRCGHGALFNVNREDGLDGAGWQAAFQHEPPENRGLGQIMGPSPAGRGKVNAEAELDPETGLPLEAAILIEKKRIKEKLAAEKQGREGPKTVAPAQKLAKACWEQPGTGVADSPQAQAKLNQKTKTAGGEAVIRQAKQELKRKLAEEQAREDKPEEPKPAEEENRKPKELPVDDPVLEAKQELRRKFAKQRQDFSAEPRTAEKPRREAGCPAKPQEQPKAKAVPEAWAKPELATKSGGKTAKTGEKAETEPGPAQTETKQTLPNKQEPEPAQAEQGEVKPANKKHTEEKMFKQAGPPQKPMKNQKRAQEKAALKNEADVKAATSLEAQFALQQKLAEEQKRVFKEKPVIEPPQLDKPQAKAFIEVKSDEPVKKGLRLKNNHLFFISFILIIGLLTSLAIFLPNNSGKIAEAANIDKKQAVKVADSLSKFGLTKIVTINRNKNFDTAEIAGAEAYQVTTKNLNNIVIYLDAKGNLVQAKCGADDLFANGKVLSQLSDYILTEKEKAKLRLNAEGIVKAVLEKPDKAEFASKEEWQITKAKDSVTVESYVSHPNDFGDIVTNDFAITFAANENDIISFICDGTELIQH